MRSGIARWLRRLAGRIDPGPSRMVSISLHREIGEFIAAMRRADGDS